MEFNKVDAQVCNALLKLRSPEMRPLLEFFNKQLESTDRSLRRAEGVMLHRMQGKAAYLEDLLTAVDNAAVNLEKLS